MTQIKGLVQLLGKKSGKTSLDDGIHSELVEKLNVETDGYTARKDDWMFLGDRTGDRNLVHRDSEYAKAFKFGNEPLDLKDTIAMGAYLACISEQHTRKLFKILKDHREEPMNEGIKITGQHTKFIDYVYPDELITFKNIGYEEVAGTDRSEITMKGMVNKREVLDVTTHFSELYHKMPPMGATVIQASEGKIKEFTEEELIEINGRLGSPEDSKMYHMIPPAVSVGTSLAYLQESIKKQEGLNKGMYFNFMREPMPGKIQVDIYRPKIFHPGKPQKSKKGAFIYRLRVLCSQIETSKPLSYGDLVVMSPYEIDFEPTV